jgi:hypothetical protein
MKNNFKTIATFLFSYLFYVAGYTQINFSVPEDVKSGFDMNFNPAELIRWEKVSNGYKAIVDHENRQIDAFFSEMGDFKGVGHAIMKNALPKKVWKKMRKDYHDYTLRDVYEYNCNTNGVCYFIGLDNEYICLVLRYSPSGKLLDQNLKIKLPVDVLTFNEVML